MTQQETTQSNTAIKNLTKGIGQVALAGLGLYWKAGKTGINFFSSLVADGEKLQTRGKKEYKQHIGTKVDGVKEKLQDNWLGVEGVVDNQIMKVMVRLGIPSQQNINHLVEQVEELNDLVKVLAQTELKENMGRETKTEASSSRAA